MNSVVRSFSLVLLLCGIAPALNAAPFVCLETNVGDVCMELLPEAAPNTVANFLRYVDDGDYNSTMIHRSEPGYIIQGGGYKWYPNAVPTAIPVDPPIANEPGLSNVRGTVAMMRMGTNTNSATSQWFINVGNNTGLNTADGGYTVFARIVKGMDIVDTITAATLYNLIPYFGSDFGTTPSTAPIGTHPANIQLTQLIYVTRAYRRDTNPALLPYQCSVTSPGDTLTEFCGSTVTFPVLVDGVLYEATMTYIAGRTGLVFSVDKTKLKVLANTGQTRATFAAGVLTIPSVRNGTRAFNNVKLTMTSTSPLEFTVTSFTPR